MMNLLVDFQKQDGMFFALDDNYTLPVCKYFAEIVKKM